MYLILSDLWSWSKTVQSSVWVAILASGTTILSIAWTIASTEKRLRKQIQEDRRRDEQKRLFESRRDIYLAAADALILGASAIGRLSDIEISTRETLKVFTERLGDIAKVHLICSSRLSDLTLQMVSEISVAMMKLTVERIPIDIVTLKKRGVSTDRPDYAEAIAEISREILPLQMIYAERCLEATVPISRLMEDLVLAVRADLETPGYEEGFRPPFKLLADKQLEAFREVIAQIRGQHIKKRLAQILEIPNCSSHLI